MSVYWLAPLTSRDPLVIGEARRKCGGEMFESFRAKVQRLSSPRHLMMFKSALLLSDDDDACGDEGETGIDFNREGDIHFAADQLSVSHCAEAFFDRLPNPREWREAFPLFEKSSEHWSEQDRLWLQVMEQWTAHDFTIVLIRED
jgi:hypothetical protein